MNTFQTALASRNLTRKPRRSYRAQAEALEGRELMASGFQDKPYPFEIFDQVGPTAIVEPYGLASPWLFGTKIDGGTVNWGDGTPESDVSIAGMPRDYSDAIVFGTHAFAESGTYEGTIHLALETPDGKVVHEDFPISFLISPASIRTVVGPSFIAAAGIAYTADDLGKFFTNVPDPRSRFRGTIDWGDGSPTSAWDLQTRVGYENGRQIYPGIVGGDHTFAKPGSYTVTTTIIGAGVTARTEAQVKVVPQPLELLDDLTLVASSGIPYTSSYQGTPGATASLPLEWVDFSRPQLHTVTVDWGDGSPTSSVGETYPSNFASHAITDLDVPHVYQKVGDYPVHVTLGNEDGLRSVEATIIHVRPETLELHAASVSAVAGLNAGIVVATLDQLPFAAGLKSLYSPHGYLYGPLSYVYPAGYSYGPLSIAIRWGDGSTSKFPGGTVNAVATEDNSATGGKVTFRIQAFHQYETPGQYSVSIEVEDISSGNGFQADTTATVVPFAASAPPISGRVGSGLSTTFLATVEVPNGSLSAGDYSASIDWGDGSPIQPATVAATASGATGFTSPLTHLVVSGTHAYATSGAFAASIRIADSQGRSRTIATTATIAPAPTPVVVIPPPVVPSPPKGHYAIVSRFGHPDGGKRVWIPDGSLPAHALGRTKPPSRVRRTT